VNKLSGRLCSGFCFLFRLFFGVCLVVVVVVERFFLHSCGAKTKLVHVGVA